MSKSRAALLAAATFVVAFGLCIALFAVLDVDAIYLIGPAVVVGAAALATYRSARPSGSHSPRT
jgi:hypothetical protein